MLMKIENQNVFEKEAIRIGKRLMELAIEDEDTIYWETVDGFGILAGRENIYSGVSGIVLFFIELYKQTFNTIYLPVIRKGSNWLRNSNIDGTLIGTSFSTGTTGVAFALLHADIILGSHSNSDRIEEIIFECDKGLSHISVDDYLVGRAGTVLGLLHILAINNSKSALDKLKLLVWQLLYKINVGPQGLFWDRNKNSTKGLCGFSHGASGLAFVFNELAFFFDNKLFKWLAEQAFLYEEFYYNKELNEYPDFRKGIYSKDDYDDHYNALISKNSSFFNVPRYMSAWCHGSPGIGLARLRSFELYQNNCDFNYFESALEVCRKSSYLNLPSYTFCHGMFGNLSLVLESYKFRQNQTDLRQIENIARVAIESVKCGLEYASGYPRSPKEDLSMFMGSAGIGYFLLQLCRPYEVLNLLCPIIDKRNIYNFSMDEFNHEVFEGILFSKSFPRTYSYFVKNGMINTLKFGSTTHSLLNDIIVHFENLILKFKVPNNIIQLFSIELTKLIAEIEANYSYQNIKEQLIIQETKCLFNRKGMISRQSLVVNPDLIIKAFKSNLNDDCTITFLPTSTGVRERQINSLSFIILDSFRIESMAKLAFEKVKLQFIEDSNVQKLYRHFILQIRELLASGQLIISTKY
jgi:hypothetical protein